MRNFFQPMNMRYVKFVQGILYSKIRKLLFWAFPDFMVRRSWLKRGKNYINEDLSDAYRLMYDMLANLCLKEKPKKILEYGCGDGYLLKEIFLKNSGNLNIEYVGIDYSPTQIENVKKFFKEGNFFVYDLTKGIHQFKDGEFDMVVSYEVIEHLKKPESFLKEIKRVLVKNGIFTLSTPNVNFPHVTTSPYHKREYKKFELVKLLREHFRKVEIYGQKKNKKAQEAFVEFLRSQDVRQKIVDSDRLGIRKLMPRGLKELIWRYFGSFYGRSAQDKLSTLDFPITKVITKDTEYFIAVCKK